MTETIEIEAQSEQAALQAIDAIAARAELISMQGADDMAGQIKEIGDEMMEELDE